MRMHPVWALPAISKLTVDVLKSYHRSGEDLVARAIADEDFVLMVSDIISNEKFLQLRNYHHHYNSIYVHSLKVAYLSYSIGIIMNSFFPIRLHELARGSLLHDFFLYDWRHEKLPKGKKHAFEHPKEAYRNSSTYISELSPIEKDVVLKHMWPLTFLPPKYIETCIVVLVDKLVAGDEFIMEAKSAPRPGRV